MTSPETEVPFAINNSYRDPLGTVREERLPEGVNVWVLEESSNSAAIIRWRHWRCLYAVGPTGEVLSGMIGQLLDVRAAAGFVPIGAVPHTPAEAAWNAHVSRETDPIGVLSAADRLAVCGHINSGRRVAAIKVVREMTGWGLHEAKIYVDRLRAEMALDSWIRTTGRQASK